MIDDVVLLVLKSEKCRKTTELELHDSEQRLTETTSLAHRAVAERKKFEADAMQYHSEVADARQELKSVDERVSSPRSIEERDDRRFVCSGTKTSG